jgi:AcrR family transcriptional regulator
MARVAKKPNVRRAELITAATRLFAKNGLTNTTVANIVKEAGVAQGTFYLYFKSKQEIGNAIVESISVKICERLSKVVSSKDLSALEKLLALIDEIFTDLISDSEVIRYFHHEANRQSHNRLNEQLAANIVPLLTEIIQQGIEEKTFNTSEPEKIALFLFGAAMLINERIIADDNGPADPWKAAIIDFTLKGLGCNPEKTLVV